MGGGAEKQAGPETREVAKEKKPPFSAELPYDSEKQWNNQILELVKNAMGTRYEAQFGTQVLALITSSGEKYSDLADWASDAASMRLENGQIQLFDEDGEAVLDSPIDISAIMSTVVEQQRSHDCAICRRENRRYLRTTFGYSGRYRAPGYAELLARVGEAGRISRERKAQAAKQPGRVSKGPSAAQKEAQDEVIANARLRDLKLTDKKDRDAYLLTAQQDFHENQYNITATIDSEIQGDDENQFERHWRDMDYSYEIDELFERDADPRAGFTVNPLKGWTHETLRTLMQEGGKSELYFQEVAAKIYNDRFEDFTKDLARRGVPNDVIKLLEADSSFLGKVPILSAFSKIGSKADDIQKTYAKLKKILVKLAGIKDKKDVPEEYKEIYPHLDKLKLTVNILGDYIVYASRLVNFVARLQYNPGLKATHRDATMHELDRQGGSGGDVMETPRNRVIQALTTVFQEGVASPTEYTSELSNLFGSDKRPITFQDLNGQTATLDGEGFTTYQSPELAYKLAYEAAEPKDATSEEVINEESSIKYLNRMIELGVTVYMERPGDRSTKEIIDGLAAVGAEVDPLVPLRFSGNMITDARNLYQTLSLENLGELQRKDTPAARLVNAERIKFIRMGSVVEQKLRARAMEKPAEAAKQKGASLKLKPAEAETIIQELRRTGKFEESQLGKLKTTLVGGGVVVLPEYGGALFAHYEFDNGAAMDFSVAAPQWESFAVGAAVGKRFQIEEDVSVTLSFGVGVDTGGGYFVGPGQKIKKEFKFKNVDAYVEAGFGLMMGSSIMPAGFAGTGLNWSRTQEKYERSLTKKEAETHVAELDATTDAYQEVKSNRSKYPEFAGLVARIEAISLEKVSQKDLFMSAYSIFKDGLQSEAIDDTAKKWYEKFIPNGIGVGVAFVPNPEPASRQLIPVIPVPYAFLQFEILNRKLVYRVSTSIQKAEQFTDAAATAAILEKCPGAQTVETKQLMMSGEITIDPESGQLMLMKGKSQASMDFSQFRHLNRFQELAAAVEKAANIGVDVPSEPELAEQGLILISPRSAHGNTQIFIDPKLGEDVVVVYKGAHVYLSVKKDREIFFKREDISYPFQERGAVEKTVITITADKAATREIIEGESFWFIERTPTTQWVQRPHLLDDTPGNRQKRDSQTNFRDMSRYAGEWEVWIGGRTDRMKFTSVEGMKESYEALLSSVTIRSQAGLPDAEIRPAILTKIQALTKDKAFLARYRLMSTEGYDLIRMRGGKLQQIHAGWNENYKALCKGIQQKTGPLNADEMNAAVMSLMIASFFSLKDAGKDHQKTYESMLESFERPMLTSILNDYYAEDPEYKALPQADRDKKVEDAVNFIIGQFKGLNVTDPAQNGKLEAGYLYATLVGYTGVTGMRRMYNYRETSPDYGVTGLKDLDPKAPGVAGEVARFWMKKLSSYEPGLQKLDVQPDNMEYQDNIFEVMHSPLALKLVPLIGVTLGKEEMTQLSQFYEGGRDTTRIRVTEDNIGVIRKVLDLCDKVRAAELAGDKDKEIAIDEHFSIKILKMDLKSALYKKCGNITGLMREEFGLVYKGSKMLYCAGSAEGIVDVRAGYSLVTFEIMAGLALPIPMKRETKPGPGPEEEITGGDVPEVVHDDSGSVGQETGTGTTQADAPDTGQRTGTVTGKTAGSAGGDGGAMQTIKF